MQLFYLRFIKLKCYQKLLKVNLIKVYFCTCNTNKTTESLIELNTKKQ